MVGLFASRFAEHPFCGASLISNKHLITAAHCIQGILQPSMLNEYAFHKWLLVMCLIANISFKSGVVAKYASLADHDTSTKKETRSFLMRIRPYRQSQVISVNIW